MRAAAISARVANDRIIHCEETIFIEMRDVATAPMHLSLHICLGVRSERRATRNIINNQFSNKQKNEVISDSQTQRATLAARRKPATRAAAKLCVCLVCGCGA